MTTAQSRYDLRSVIGEFQIHGDFQSGEPYGSGHINDTFCVVFDQAGTRVRYILQRLNHQVFPQPEVVMANIQRATAHLAAKLRDGGTRQCSRRCLTLVPGRDSRCWLQDGEGNCWRCYLFIEGASTHDQVRDPRQAFHAAKAFGEFQRLLLDLPGEPLVEPIPNFHNTRYRFEALTSAVDRDVANRARDVKPEMAFCWERESMVDALLKPEREGVLPRRVVHGDTKLNNVMLDDRTGEGVCVIDLDTVMPGQVLHDFGDMCRTTTCLAPEDEQDLSRVEPNMEMFQALAGGYVAAFGKSLTGLERDLMAFSANLVSFEIGIRFLEDYLAGDRYFKVRRPGQNLDRARAQFKLVRAFEERQGTMQELVARAFHGFDRGESSPALSTPPTG